MLARGGRCRFKSPKHEDAVESECFQNCESCEAAEQFVGIVDIADTQRSNSWVSQILQIPSGAIRRYRRQCRYPAEQFAGIVGY